MQKHLALAIATLLACAAIGSAPASAAMYGPAGSWQTSCRGAQINGSVFSASCTNTSGQWVRSYIDMNSCPSGLLGNNNGHLFCEGGGRYGGGRYEGGYTGNLPGGSWQRSCNSVGQRGPVVYASCSNGHGMQSTSINMRSCPGWALGNNDGNLFCEAGGGNYGGGPTFGGSFPGGSWQNSCRSPGINGPVFSAQCTNDNSVYRYSSINMQGCPSRAVGNRNGVLFCEY